ncbi:MAG TPA: cobalamin-dependent protein, partial [Thermodesulfobacteriota bacterium]|nr:cobalamin-dependent protein [Thermodesulfobacteriota bacterium]
MRMKSSQNGEDLLRDLERSVFDYDGEKAVLLSREVVDRKVDLVSAIDCLTHAITLIGDRFGSGELFLPDLVGAGRVVDQAMAILEEGIRRTGQQERYKGVVVIGTVLGDIHSIGKNMVAAFCRAAGFKVIDMGENVSAEKLMEAVKNNNPDILALSSLLTTTMAEQQKMIKSLGEKEVRKSLKIMVGGGPVTREFAKGIGADGYAPTAPAAAKLALKLIGRDERS